MLVAAAILSGALCVLISGLISRCSIQTSTDAANKHVLTQAKDLPSTDNSISLAADKEDAAPTVVDTPASADFNDPVSVSYFPSRKCNYACGFCFHTDTNDYILPIDKAKRGLRLLKEAGMQKLNIAGGEPFLHPKFLTEILRFCKEALHVESISIVSNGSKIRREWMRKNCQWLDILAVSCDFFNPETNKLIGRSSDGGNVMRLMQIAEWCKTFGIKIKLNTVVNIHDWDEDMVKHIQRLAPFRWKVFQCLIVEGENDNKDRIRDANRFLITDEQWQTFCNRHRHLPCYVPEDNSSMTGSYLLLDENMRFMDKGKGKMKLSDPILEVGDRAAMAQVVWDKKSFIDRGGIYDWGRPDVGQQRDMSQPKSCAGGGGNRKELEY